MSRIGVEWDFFAAGVSVKWQDGIGSDGQKMYNNHVGADLMIRRGRFTLSGEVIYDQYGFRRGGFDPNDITWERSIYYRDQNLAVGKPITGVGYYVNLDYETECWTITLNYGEFHPEQIGDPLHDVTTRRGIGKIIYHRTPCLDFYSMLLLENDVAGAQAGRLRRGIDVLAGVQFAF